MKYLTIQSPRVNPAADVIFFCNLSTQFHDDNRTREIDNRTREIDNRTREIDNRTREIDNRIKKVIKRNYYREFFILSSVRTYSQLSALKS